VGLHDEIRTTGLRVSQYNHPVTLTLKELEAVAMELERSLRGARFHAIALADAETAILAFDCATQEIRVLVCTRPRYARIHRTTRPLPRARRGESSHPFLKAARAMVGMQVSRVGCRFQDRVLQITLEQPAAPSSPPAPVQQGVVRRARREPGPAQVLCLLFECTGHHPNLFVTDAQDLILASLTPSRSYRRDLRPGRRYQRPLQHPSERMEAMRFVSSPHEPLSELIEAHYQEVGSAEAQRLEAARARREVRKMIARDERLLAGLLEDLDEQGRAAEALGGEPPAPDRDRLQRLAARREQTRERIARIERRLERLRQRLRVLESEDTPTRIS